MGTREQAAFVVRMFPAIEQIVRKLSGFTVPSKANETAFQRAAVRFRPVG
jgi:hypothetical protein